MNRSVPFVLVYKNSCLALAFSKRGLKVLLRLIGLALLLILPWSPAQAQSSRWTIRGSEAYDRATNLTWQRCAVGQRYFENDCVGSARTMTHDDAKSQQVAGYRLPTRDELTSLIVKNKKAPLIDEQIFVNFDGCCYWTSEVVSGSPENAWVVVFGYGRVDGNARSDTLHVRLVRSGQ